MNKWEYLAIALTESQLENPNSLMQLLDQNGSNGWELIDIYDLISAPGYGAFVVFKRPTDEG